MALIALSIAGHDFVVSSLAGRAALSELFRFEIRATIAESPPALADLLAQPFTLTLADPFERTLVVQGVVMDGRREAQLLGGASFALALEPAVAPLGVGKNSRVFQEMTAVDVVKKVLETAGVAASSTRWATSGSYEARPYIAQHRESDWAFIERLLAEEGIYYWFEHSDDETKLVLSDDSTTAPELEGGAEIPFQDDAGLHASRDTVSNLRRAAKIAPQAVRLRDYNFDKPKLQLDAKSGEGAHEIYDFPGRFQVPAVGDQRAKTRLEALRAGAAVLSGDAGTTRLRAGLILELGEHPIEALNGRYLVTSVSYAASLRRDGGGGAAEGVRNGFTAIPVATPFRPKRAAVTEAPGGPQTGVVVGASGKEIDPDKGGRTRVQFYWDREGAKDDKASTFMRVGQFALGGSMILPRIGWDVLVDHHQGDVDDPFVVLHLYDGQFPVPYGLPANKTRTAWQTATTPGGGSTNEIRFEDKKGGEEMFVNASKDMNVVVGDNRSEKVGVNSDESIGANLDVSIGSNLKIGVKADQSVSVGASETLTVSGNRSVVVNGSETGSIGASRTVTVQGASLEAVGGRTLTVGGSMMAASALGVSRMVLGSLSVSVGGAWISAAATGLANLTAGAAAETVGGAKIQACPAACNLSVKGALAETVGGAYIIAAGGNAAESAKGSLTINVGGAMVANAPKISVEGKSEISIIVGGASITIKSGSVEVKAPTLASPGAKIKKKASAVHHN